MLLGEPPGRTPRIGPLDARPTLALVDEAGDVAATARRASATSSLDEAQDLSPMMLRAVGRRCEHRVDDRARRPRPGHDAVGDAVVGRGAGPPRPAGRRASSELVERLPGARARSSTTPRGCCRSSPRRSRRPTSVRRSAGELDLRRTRDPLAGLVVAVRAGARAARARSGVVVAGRRGSPRSPAALGAAGVAYDAARRRPATSTAATSRRRRVDLVPGVAGQGPGVRPRRARSSPPRSSPPRPTRSPGCAGSTSCLTRAVTTPRGRPRGTTCPGALGLRPRRRRARPASGLKRRPTPRPRRQAAGSVPEEQSTRSVRPAPAGAGSVHADQSPGPRSERSEQTEATRSGPRAVAVSQAARRGVRSSPTRSAASRPWLRPQAPADLEGHRGPRLLLHAAAGLGQADDHEALVGAVARTADQAHRLEALEQRREGARLERETLADASDRDGGRPPTAAPSPGTAGR